MITTTSADKPAAALVRVAVQLLIYSDKLSPRQIAEYLHIHPTRAVEKGVKAGARTGTPVAVPRHLWELSSESEVATQELPSHLDWLLSKLLPVSAQLRILRDDELVRSKLVAVVWGNGEIAHAEVCIRHMKSLVDLELNLEFEFADYAEDS
jgi:hypothetical protein